MVLVTVNVYVPPELVVGWATVVELKPVPGLQLQVRFATDAVPIVVVGLVHVIVLSNPASAVGLALSDAVSYTHLDVYKRQRQNRDMQVP